MTKQEFDDFRIEVEGKADSYENQPDGTTVVTCTDGAKILVKASGDSHEISAPSVKCPVCDEVDCICDEADEHELIVQDGKVVRAHTLKEGWAGDAVTHALHGLEARSDDDVAAVEYFDQHPNERDAILDNFEVTEYDNPQAVRAEFELIKAGKKAHCLG